MKRALLGAALLAAVLTAQAKDLLVAPTKAGGEIVLTKDRSNTCGEVLFSMYIVMTDQNLLFGCWAYLDGRIMVRFDDGTRRAYGPETFTVRTVD